VYLDPKIPPGRSDIAARRYSAPQGASADEPADPACTSRTCRASDSSQGAPRAEDVVDNQRMGARECLLDAELTIKIVRTTGTTPLGLGSELSPTFYTYFNKATPCGHCRCKTLTEAEQGAVMPGYYDDDFRSRQRGVSGDHLVG
jgi:hypothetical protein